MQGKQRRAFKGLALLPLPVGLTLFKGAPAATAAIGVPTIGVGATGLAATSGAGVGAAGVGAAGAVTATTAGAGAAAGAGGVVVGGSVVGGAAAKVAAVVVAATVATGVGYKGVEAVTDKPASKPPVASTQDRAGATRATRNGAERGAREPRGAARVAREGARRRRGAGSPQAGRGAGPATWADGCSSQGAQRRGLESRGALGPRLRERPGESALPDECSQGAWRPDVAEDSRQVAARPA